MLGPLVSSTDRLEKHVGGPHCVEKFKRRAGDGVLKVREMAEERLDTVPRFRDPFGSSSLIRSPATDHSWDLTQETGGRGFSGRQEVCRWCRRLGQMKPGAHR